MPTPSNLYAEKIYAEHPVALWSLDDKADYISLVDEPGRDVTTWNIENGSASVYSLSDEPFPDSQTTKITGTLTDDDFSQIVCVSNDITNFSTLNQTLATFSIGGFFNSISAYASSFEIGYEYYDTTSGARTERLKKYTTSVKDKWFFISETFDIPEDNTEFRIIIKINYIGGASSEEDYQFLINGITVGQWAEEFNSSSLGINPVNIPSTIAINTTKGIVANAYGLQNKKGYYLANNNFLAAKNTGIPLVYGASNLTKILPNNGQPSVIIPSLGFLGDEGQYKNYTLECWVRINSDSLIKKRIIGPIGSDDGLYIEGPFLVLKIGNNSGSYYVGEWTRPMLVHIRVSENYSSLLINGEEVISLNYLTSELLLPPKINSLGKEQDWIGFYSYEDVNPFEIDCVAIYTYQVPLLLAKKRFAFGQAVDIPEGINQAYSGSSVYIDYSFADYTNNYSYPNIGKWNQAIIDNLVVESNRLKTPEYELPEIILSSGSLESLYSVLNNQQSESDNFFSFSSIENAYMLFKDFNFLKQKVRSFYGSFKILEEPLNKQILFRVEAQNSQEYFEITVSTTGIEYVLSSVDMPLAKFSYPGEGTVFSVGVDLDNISNYFGGKVASFFGNQNILKMYVCGKSNLTQTFKGNVYSVGLCTDRNHNIISNLFNAKGIPIGDEDLFDIYLETPDVIFNSSENYFGNNPAEWENAIDGGDISSFAEQEFQSHTASYTLSPSKYFDTYTLDIDIQGYWEDYIPLTYFAQYVKNKKNKDYYDLDLIQFNVNYPAPSIFIEEEQAGSWTYQELKNEYTIPLERSYSSLDNQLFTGYLDYSDLKNKVYKNYKYDTSKSLVRSYITFQYIKNGANVSQSNFTNIQKPSNDSIVNPGEEWINTKYEVINNMIIYPPSNVSVLDLAIVTHLEFNVKRILKNKVEIRNMEYASQAFNSTSPNPIGTKFGNQLYPYKKAGFYYSYKDKNPFTIYKGSSPYLYLTRYTGIEIKGVNDPLINRGLAIPINKEMSSNFKVMAMQSAIRYDQDSFPYAATEIFEIKSKNAHIKFYMSAIHPTGQRAKIYAINVKTGNVEDGIAFYWNGKIVKEPVITVKEWGFLGISFPNLLNFENMSGSINLNGPITFNTISYYQSTNLQEVQQIEVRPWFAVKNSSPLTLEWDYWKSSSYMWDGVLILASTSYYGVDPAVIYKTYTGTNKIIIDTDKVFSVNSYEYKVYSDILVFKTTVDAV